MRDTFLHSLFFGAIYWSNKHLPKRPQFANSIELGISWGFEYKTVAFVWDKQVHNPGRYTLSQTEFVLAFKKGKFPTPRGARNVQQLISVHRGEHSEKPEVVIDGITKMFPSQKKIELFARKNYVGWDNWGLEIPDHKVEILSQGETKEKTEEKDRQLSFTIFSYLGVNLSDLDGHFESHMSFKSFPSRYRAARSKTAARGRRQARERNRKT